MCGTYQAQIHCANQSRKRTIARQITGPGPASTAMVVGVGFNGRSSWARDYRQIRVNARLLFSFRRGARCPCAGPGPNPQLDTAQLRFGARKRTRTPLKEETITRLLTSRRNLRMGKACEGLNQALCQAQHKTKQNKTKQGNWAGLISEGGTAVHAGS